MSEQKDLEEENETTKGGVELPAPAQDKRPLYIMVGGIVFVLLVFICIPGFHHHPSQQVIVSATQHTKVNLTAQAQEDLQIQRARQKQLVQYIKQATGGKGLTSSQTQTVQLQQELINEQDENNQSDSLINSPNFSQADLDAYSSNSTGAGGDSNANPDAIVATRIEHPNYIVVQSEVISATIDTAIDSDLPGLIRGVVSEAVYSYIGGKVLIPPGTRLVGQYGSGIVRGQSRILVMWKRAILPNGITININSPGIGPVGRSGIEADNINHHFLERYNAAIMLSLAGAYAANSGVSNSSQPNSADMVRQTAAAGFLATAASSVAQNANIPNTLQSFQGKSVSAFVGHDLDFYHVLHDDS
jgi:type IV secretion system protein VirB10